MNLVTTHVCSAPSECRPTTRRFRSRRKGPTHDMASDTDLASEETFDEETLEDETLDLADEEVEDSDDEVGDSDDEVGDSADDDGDEETEAEALDELEAEELEMLTEDESSETIVVDEAAEMRAIRRAEIAMEGEPADEAHSDEFVCSECFLVKNSVQLANKRRKVCKDCAS